MKVTRSLPWSVVPAALVLGGADLACGSDTAPPATVYENGGTNQGGSGGSSSPGGASGTGGASGVGGLIVDSGAGGGIRPDSGCAVGEVQGRLIPANLLFVMDRSGSMNCNLPPTMTSERCERFPGKDVDAEPSKWEVFLPAFKDALSAVQMNNSATSVGVAMFPALATTEFPVQDTDCEPWKMTPAPAEPVADLDVALLDGAHKTAIDTFLDGVSRTGKTPLAGATLRGYRYLQNRIVTGQLTGNHFLVLVTDGFDTCGPEYIPGLYSAPANYVQNALALGIRTFVIGVPGSEDARGLLSEIAFLGGTARAADCEHNPTGAVDPTKVCHFDMTTSTNFGADLTAALDAINRTVLSCEIDVPTGANVDRNRVNVQINDRTIGKDEKPCATEANGWQYKVGDPNKIELCGQACTDAKAANTTLRVVLGCITVPA